MFPPRNNHRPLPVANMSARSLFIRNAAPSRLLSSSPARASFILSKSSSSFSPYVLPTELTATRLPSFSSVRPFHNSFPSLSKDTTWSSKGNIPYSEVKKLASEPTGEVTLIDVREPDEVAAGMIPSAVNVPLTQFEKAFNPNGGVDFQEKYAFPRPSFDSPLVFYCRSGKRSAQAQEIARRNGWQKYVYSGVVFVLY